MFVDQLQAHHVEADIDQLDELDIDLFFNFAYSPDFDPTKRSRVSLKTILSVRDSTLR